MYILKETVAFQLTPFVTMNDFGAEFSTFEKAPNHFMDYIYPLILENNDKFISCFNDAERMCKTKIAQF